MGLFLRSHDRRKNGKDHKYWSIVENKRCAGGKVVQRQVLYLGELTQAQQQAWEEVAEQIEPTAAQTLPLPLLPLPSPAPPTPVGAPAPQVDFKEFSLHHPRQWGACWVAAKLWADLRMEQFWSPRLPCSREGTHWRHILQTLVAYRLIDPGSEFRLHREWYANSAMGDLLGEDFSLAAKDNLYRCLDKLLEHRQELFSHLRERWTDLFEAKFDVLLYDLTSTYFESDPPFPEGDPRRFGYSRDKRSDCVQVVVALIITPEGYPIAYEVLPGNTSDKTTLKSFLKLIRKRYGKENRTWVMDRGIPTEESLAIMRKPRHRIFYLVGTPRGRLTKLESKLTDLPWQQARESVSVKLLDAEGEMYVYVLSQDRVRKERAMRRKKLKGLWARLKELQQMKGLSRDDLMLKVGQAKEKAGNAYGLVEIRFPEAGEPVDAAHFTFRLRKEKLRQRCHQEGRYLLRTNLTGREPKILWEHYLQLVEIEAAFKNLKGDLEVRPIYHQKSSRVEAHIFVAFLAYCLHVTLRGHLKKIARGLTPRSLLEKFANLQLVDVHLPLKKEEGVAAKKLVLTRFTQPDKDQRLLLAMLKWELPDQPPPRITAERDLELPKTNL